MLVLSRKPGETIVIDGVIRIQVVEIKNGQVRLGISAPRHHQIHRQEVLAQIEAENQAATAAEGLLTGLQHLGVLPAIAATAGRGQAPNT